MMVTETWYVLEDGSVADPREVAGDEKGVLKHKDGRAVGYAPHGPRSKSVDADEERKKKSKTVVEKPSGDTWTAKDAKADDHVKSTYRTRESKAD